MTAPCSSVCPSSFLTSSPRITVLRIPSAISTGFAPGCHSSEEECYSLPYRSKRKLFLFLIRVTLRPQIFDIHYYLKVCPSRARGGSAATHQCNSTGRREGKTTRGTELTSPSQSSGSTASLWPSLAHIPIDQSSL